MEFVRHRTFSFTQESTRYCNYSKDKFGNDLTFIIPCWMNEIELKEEFGDLTTLEYHKDIEKFQSSEWSDAANFLQSLAWCESNYLTLLQNGWKPQQARAVLPNSLKTELIMTGFISDWKHFFMLRCAPGAHPQAQEIAIPLEQEFKQLGLL
jgi:thymidylate synthase (FAD)